MTEQDELNELNEILEKYQPVRPLTAKDIRSLSKLMNMCSLSDIKVKNNSVSWAGTSIPRNPFSRAK
jgi:hypothetical protein